MPEALARAQPDFKLARRAPGGRASAIAGTLGRALLRQFSARPATTIAGAAFAALMTGIVLNALVMQNARHPAPLFGTARPRAVPSPASAASEAVPSVLPPPRPVDPGTRPLQDADATPQPGPAPRPAGPARKAGEADGAGKDDAIGQFLKAGAQAAGPGRKTEIATGNADDSLGQFLRNGGAGKSSADGDRIVAAQRALSRLGYSVKVDGVMGGTTKRAIERFERDHHLAAKGELTSGLLRQLLLAAGASAE